MARLPTVETFGPRPTPRSSRAVVPVRADIVQTAEAAGARQAAEAAGGIADIAAGFAEQMAQAKQRIQTKRDAVERARDYGTFGEVGGTEGRRIQTEEDPSSLEVTAAYRAFLEKKKAEVLENHKGGEASRLILAERLERQKFAFIREAGIASAVAQNKLVTRALDVSLGVAIERVLENPAEMTEILASLDEDLADMSAALPPEQVIDQQVTRRDILAKAAVDSFLDRGDYREARRIMRETPGLEKILSPESQIAIQRRIAAFENAETEARIAGQIKIQELETILGRKATPLERARAAGVAPPAGKQTLEQKVAEVEAALDRPLSQGEKSRLVGLEPPQAVSQQGKVIQDRQKFIAEYGEDSEQVQAFDELAADPGGPPSLSDIGGQRKEFTRLSGVFVDVRDSFNRVTTSIQTPSAAGDLSLIFNFMKMLDPASVVRESEFAQAAATGSLGQRFVAVGARLFEGKRLSDDIRADFANQAELLMEMQLKTQLQLEAQFRDLATRAGINPDDVVIDFVGPFRPGGALQPTTGGGGFERQKPRFKVDLEGNILGAE